MNGATEIGSSYDVIVVGSGAGGMVSALRAHDLGLSVLVAEKSHHYGGTSATSAGGTWIPMNDAVSSIDSVDRAMTYLRAVVGDPRREGLLKTYVENALPMTRYLEGLGVRSFAVPGYPDYYSDAPGALASRAMMIGEMDGAELGDEFFFLRDHHPIMLAFNRYAMSPKMAGTLSAKLPGWQFVALKMLIDYWCDLPWRLRTRKDRRLTLGRALIGALRKAMMQRNIPLALNARLVKLEKDGSRISSAVFEQNGRRIHVSATRAIVLAAGGFEQDQQMRDRHLPITTETESSVAPKNGNKGDAIRLGQAVGAALDNMDSAWWCPSMRMPSRLEPNMDLVYPLFFDRGLPRTICVNRFGKRFVNEAVSYDQFGRAMIADQLATGHNSPCWMIFDAGFRKKYNAGGLLPSDVMPDKNVPEEWWNNVIHRDESVDGLAVKIGVDGRSLVQTVTAFNGYAKTGLDLEFGRGVRDYDRFFGDRRTRSNPCLGPLDKAPYYAIPVELGDLGTNGGLHVDERAAVLDQDGRPIGGLYAVGNTAASVFGGCYPGGGVTLGQAMIFGYIAANAAHNELAGSGEIAR